MAKTQKYTYEQVADALKENYGTLAITADKMGCDVATIYRYLKRYPTLNEIVDHFRERRVDKAELALERAIGNGEAWAVALTLKTIGKSRGYVERQEIEHDFKDVSDSELIKRATELARRISAGDSGDRKTRDNAIGAE